MKDKQIYIATSLIFRIRKIYLLKCLWGRVYKASKLRKCSLQSPLFRIHDAQQHSKDRTPAKQTPTSFTVSLNSMSNYLTTDALFEMNTYLHAFKHASLKNASSPDLEVTVSPKCSHTGEHHPVEGFHL